VTSGFGAEDGKGLSGDRTRELLELVRPRALSRASSPQVPACGGFGVWPPTSANVCITQLRYWWRIHRPKAPNAIREGLDRGSSLIAVQPEVGARTKFGFTRRAHAPRSNPL
jgi:hypothetical protein